MEKLTISTLLLIALLGFNFSSVHGYYIQSTTNTTEYYAGVNNTTISDVAHTTNDTDSVVTGGTSVPNVNGEAAGFIPPHSNQNATQPRPYSLFQTQRYPQSVSPPYNPNQQPVNPQYRPYYPHGTAWGLYGVPRIPQEGVYHLEGTVHLVPQYGQTYPQSYPTWAYSPKVIPYNGQYPQSVPQNSQFYPAGSNNPQGTSQNGQYPYSVQQNGQSYPTWPYSFNRIPQNVQNYTVHPYEPQGVPQNEENYTAPPQSFKDPIPYNFQNVTRNNLNNTTKLNSSRATLQYKVRYPNGHTQWKRFG